MSVFGEIVHRLFGKAKPNQSPPPTEPAPFGVTSTSAASAPAPLRDINVEMIMDQLVRESGQTLNWRTSIVDTMKALGIDSSLARRKQLAQELKYGGDMNDSAGMNIWLHKEVMKALAANGGRLPQEFLH